MKKEPFSPGEPVPARKYLPKPTRLSDMSATEEAFAIIDGPKKAKDPGD